MTKSVSFAVAGDRPASTNLWSALLHSVQRLVAFLHLYVVLLAHSDTPFSPLLRGLSSLFRVPPPSHSHSHPHHPTLTLGGIDAIWLLLSHYDGFNPVCVASFTLGCVPPAGEVRAAWAKLAAQCPRFACRLSGAPRRFRSPAFVPDEDFDMGKHIFYEALPAPAGRRELDAFIAEVRTRPWDLDRPLWDVHIIENYRGGGGGECSGGDTDPHPDAGAKAAVVARAHHSISDGQGFILSYISLTSCASEVQRLLAEGAHTLRSAKMGRLPPSRLSGLLRPLDGVHSRMYQPGAPSLLARGSTLLAQLALRGLYVFACLLEGARSACYALRMLGLFLRTFGAAPKAMPGYDGPRVPDKECATTTPVSLEAVRRIQTAFSGAEAGSLWDVCVQKGRRYRPMVGHLTLNDVFCTILADVLAQEIFRVSTSETNRHAPIVIGVPVSARPIGDSELRNLSTGVFVYLYADTDAEGGLPTDEHALYRRLHRCKGALAMAKHALIFTATFKVRTWLLGQVPFVVPSPLWPKWLHPVAAQLQHLMQSSATAVFTNVPGPSPREHRPGSTSTSTSAPASSVDFASAPILTWTASPPQMGKNTLALGLMTYNGWASLTICADKVPLGRLSAAQRAAQVQVGGGAEDDEGEYTRTAARLASAFERRFAEYLAAAEQVLELDAIMAPLPDETEAEAAAQSEGSATAGAGRSAEQRSTTDAPSNSASAAVADEMQGQNASVDLAARHAMCDTLGVMKVWAACALFLMGVVLLGPEDKCGG